mmetsp:Transcript_38715/g.86466  ORF Transcript_38715/g.86466 Transcript_38715/m.86466 type:complete len:222 (-) Transcript_38715:232-897(-)
MVRASQALDAGCTTREYVDAKWSEELRRQSMDEVGMRDYALDDMGAKVVHGAAHTSATYTAPGAILSTDAKKKLGLGRDVGGPEDAINTGRSKGDCFAFNGQSGHLTIKLAAPVVPTAVTLEHLSKVFSEKGGDSAPKEFRVIGYETAESLEASQALAEDEAALEGHLLAQDSYDLDKQSPVQVFPVVGPPAPVAFVRLEVLSNHGNQDYTCVYRLRVHSE